eukprot:2495376-Rhodomonas_salina.1
MDRLIMLEAGMEGLCADCGEEAQCTMRRPRIRRKLFNNVHATPITMLSVPIAPARRNVLNGTDQDKTSPSVTAACQCRWSCVPQVKTGTESLANTDRRAWGH